MPNKQTRAQGASSRQRIAEAAIRVIAERGFDVVSVRSVAQESGLSAGTVQYHYRTRKDLLIAALERSVERQAQRAMAVRGGPGHRASLSRTLRELLPGDGVRDEDAAAWVSFGAAASTRDWLAELYWGEMCSFQGLVRDALARAQKDGVLREGLSPDTAAPLVTALVNGLTLDCLNAPEPVRRGAEDALGRGLALILSD